MSTAVSESFTILRAAFARLRLVTLQMLKANIS